MGTVQIHYEIPDVLLNNKDYVSSKDKDSVYTFFSTVTCSNADTYEWAQKRRGSDSAFMARLPTDSLAPCGLVNIALFTDSYLFERDLGASWEAVTIDESRVALPADDESFNKVTQDNGTIYLQNSRASWLTPDILEHWKVWQRTPPGQTVRNLWGYVEGGLELGTYRINFTENSAIWEEWGAPEKRLIITGNPSWLGNPGAMQAVAGCMFFLGGLEFVLFFAFLVMIFGWQSVPTGAGDPVDIEPMEAEPTARVSVAAAARQATPPVPCPPAARRNGSLLLWTVDSGARSTAGSGPRGPPRPPEVPQSGIAGARFAEWLVGNEVPRVDCADEAGFQNALALVAQRVPVVMLNLNVMPATQKWDVEYLRSHCNEWPGMNVLRSDRSQNRYLYYVPEQADRDMSAFRDAPRRASADLRFSFEGFLERSKQDPSGCYYLQAPLVLRQPASATAETWKLQETWSPGLTPELRKDCESRVNWQRLEALQAAGGFGEWSRSQLFVGPSESTGRLGVESGVVGLVNIE
ncbi:unnamed protein product [Durusdinium trenchii]|uniref:Uncharacterized protein n=1 Tax=Durusdinium trenchii TaxID=1381693 RepID=A0ABP0IWJ1_9DINO